MPARRVDRASQPVFSSWSAYDLVVLDRVAVRTLPPGRYLIVGTVPETLPVEVGATTRGVTVLRSVATHPLLRLADLSGIRVEEAYTIRPRGGTVLAEGAVPLLWVLERPDLRAALLPFDLLRSDLPLHPAFPILMANALQWLAPTMTVEAGTSLVLPAPAGQRGRLIDPSGRTTVVEARNGALALPRLEEAGLHILRSGDAERPIVVTAPPGESDLRATAPSAGSPATGRDLRQQELWSILLFFGIGVLLLEGFLWLRAQPVLRLAPRLGRALPALRLAVLVLLVLALAGLEVVRGGRELAVVFAVDFSDSVPPPERQRALDLARAAVADRRTGDRFGLVTFGAEALVAEGLTVAPRLAAEVRPPAHRSDIGAALRTALGVLPPSGPRRIVLLQLFLVQGELARFSIVSAGRIDPRAARALARSLRTARCGRRRRPRASRAAATAALRVCSIREFPRAD